MAGGYLDNQGKPSQTLLNEIQFVDASIGKMVAALKSTGDYASTLIVITAKHGQSPVDSSRYTGIGTPAGSPITTSPATILANCLPDSEVNQIGPTEDDVSLLWLNGSCTTANAVNQLQSQSPASSNVAGIGQIFSGPGIAQLFDAPGLPPQGDPRTPDIVVTPNVGVTYSGSVKKQAEHGGFAHDDTNVVMLLSNPSFNQSVVTTPVATAQVAPTILQALGLDPNALDAVKLEGTEVLPRVFSK
jgi:arylsulfatase A-like enzyme